jgi:hypothetical protein
MTCDVRKSWRNVSRGILNLNHTLRRRYPLGKIATAFLLMLTPVKADGTAAGVAAQKSEPPPRSHIVVCTDDPTFLNYVRSYVATHLGNKYTVVDGAMASYSDIADVTAVYIGRPLAAPSDSACVAKYPALVTAVSQVVNNVVNLPLEPGSPPPKPSFSSAIKYDSSGKAKIAVAAFCYLPQPALKACSPSAVRDVFGPGAGSTK